MNIRRACGCLLKLVLTVVLLCACIAGGCVACSQHSISEETFENVTAETVETALSNEDEESDEPTDTEHEDDLNSSEESEREEEASDESATPSTTISTSEPSEYSIEELEVLSEPLFTDDELSYASSNLGFESYSALDQLGRCGEATACLGTETMPAEGEERGSIGMIKPSGWHTVRYDDLIDGNYLYNRCHLIGWQLGNENANRRNLVTGTRQMNVEEMLPYENEVATYIHETDNHVLYRVTPIFVGEELVCRGVFMEAYSLEDDGRGVCFAIWCPNEQDGIEIDYATGESVRQS